MNGRGSIPLKAMALGMLLFFMVFFAFESPASARAGGGRSIGSRGFTSTPKPYQSPTPARPAQTPGQPGMTQQTPAPPASPLMGRGLFSGLAGGLLGGMIGSMLFGKNAGAEVARGGGFALGDFIIILAILAIALSVIRRFRGRKAMEMSSAYPIYGASSPAYPMEPAPDTYEQPSPRTAVISRGMQNIAQTDPSFDETRFKETAEDYFFKIQSAWTKRDLGDTKSLFTPQMLATFQNEVSRFVAEKKINRLENIAVRQVTIVDAVQDQGEEFITVKFLASLLDYTVDETTGQAVSGSTSEPVKFLEYWTFTRKVGQQAWLLAGITQEGDHS